MVGREIFWQKTRRMRNLVRFVAGELGSAFDAVGGWFFTFLLLGIIGITLFFQTGSAPLLFFLMVTYATVLSLVLSSPFHTLLTRYLADVVFAGDFARILPNVYGASLLALGAGVVGAGLPVFCFSEVPLHLKVVFVGLSGQLGLLWTINTVLFALFRARMMGILFLAGLAGSAGVFFLFRPTETHLLILLFTGGLAVPVAGGYAYLTKAYLRQKVEIRWDFLRIHASARVALSLFLFNLGFWVDKVIFWVSSKTSVRLDPFFRYSPDYDYPFFVAFSTMMFAFFLIYRGIEGDILDPYEKFVTKVAENFPFREVALEKFRFYLGVHHSATALIVHYGGFVGVVLLLLWFKGLIVPWSNPVVFHFILAGCVAYALYHLYFLTLQYLDEYGFLVLLNGLFVGLNAGITILSIEAGWGYYGVGFLVSAACCALVAMVAVEKGVGALEFRVFRKAVQRRG